MSDNSIYQVIRVLPDLKQLVGEYESIHRAKFIMNKAAKHNSNGKYLINQKKIDAFDIAEQLAIDIALNK